MTAAVSRLNVAAQEAVGGQIAPVAPVAPHKLPPAGLIAFDPNYPDVDLTMESAVEQMRALHQFRANLSVFEAADQMTKSTLSLSA
jgi:flagellar basal body rod protein FlgC